MSTKRKRYSSAFKAKVAVEAIRGVKTTAELASEHQVHPTLISQWKRQALENLASLFEGGGTRAEPDVEAVTEFERLFVSERRLSLVEARPRTGRRHQIRRHLAGLGYPIINDRQYGDSNYDGDLALQAQHLRFADPEDGTLREASLPKKALITLR